MQCTGFEPRLRRKKTTLSQGKAVAVVPFWAVATRPASATEAAAASGQGWSELKYQWISMGVPPAPSLNLEGGGCKKVGKAKPNIVLKTIAMVKNRGRAERVATVRGRKGAH